MYHSMTIFKPPEFKSTLSFQQPSGRVFPSFPAYASSLLKRAHVYLSPANLSLFQYALYFYFRLEKSKSLYFLHLLYLKCLLVRIRQEERRRQSQLESSPKAAASGPAERKVEAISIRPSSIISQSDEASLDAKLKLLQMPSTPANMSGHFFDDHKSPLSFTSSHPPRRRSSISSLTQQSATLLSYPFSTFFDFFVTFVDGAIGSYLSQHWTEQDIFLTANRELPLPQRAAALARAATIKQRRRSSDKNGSFSFQPTASSSSLTSVSSESSLMDQQAALVSSLNIPSPRSKVAYTEENESLELEVIEILREDENLNHFPIDWATLLMLTHDSYVMQLAQLQQAHEMAARGMSHAGSEINLSGQPAESPMNATPSTILIPSSLSAPAESPLSSSASTAFVSSASAIPSSYPPHRVCDVVLQALHLWRLEKQQQRRIEREAMTQEQIAAIEQDLCYVPLKPIMGLAEQVAAESAVQMLSNDSPTAPANISTRARRRWLMLRSEFHRQRLLKSLRIQREFYLALAKHRVLNHQRPRTMSAQALSTSRSSHELTMHLTTSLSPPSSRISPLSNPPPGTPGFKLSLPNQSFGPSPLHASTSTPAISSMFRNNTNSHNLESEHQISPINDNSSEIAALNPRPIPLESPNNRDGEDNSRSPSPSRVDDFTPVVVDANDDAPRRPIVLFLAGGLAAGKSTVLAHLRATGNLFGISDDAVLVEADKFKLVDPLFQSLPATDASRSNFVHEKSLATADETLLAAVRSGRDIIVDGTLQWKPYVEQTFDFIRSAHLRRYKRGRGYYRDSETGEVTEEYFVVDEEAEEIAKQLFGDPQAISQTTGAGEDAALARPPLIRNVSTSRCCPLPPPYLIAMLGVTVEWPIAVTRSIRRAVCIGRAVPIKQLLQSHKSFAHNFDAYSEMVDAFSLVDNSNDDMRLLTTLQSPTLICYKSFDDSAKQIYQPQLLRLFNLQKNMPVEANNADEMEKQLHAVGELTSLPVPLASVNNAVDPATALLPAPFKWLLSRVSGDDDIISDAESSDEEDRDAEHDCGCDN